MTDCPSRLGERLGFSPHSPGGPQRPAGAMPSAPAQFPRAGPPHPSRAPGRPHGMTRRVAIHDRAGVGFPEALHHAGAVTRDPAHRGERREHPAGAGWLLFWPLGGTPQSRGRPQRGRRRASGRARCRRGGAAHRSHRSGGPVALAAPARAPCGRRETPAIPTTTGPQAPRRESPRRMQRPAPPSATAGGEPRSGSHRRGRAGPRRGAGDGHGAGAGGDAQGIVHPDVR